MAVYNRGNAKLSARKEVEQFHLDETAAVKELQDLEADLYGSSDDWTDDDYDYY